MAAEKAAPRKKSSSLLAALLLLTLALLVGSHLLTLRAKIADAEAQKAALAAQVEDRQRENDSLSAALDKADDPEYLQELAREQLDMVAPGERVFYDVSN